MRQTLAVLLLLSVALPARAGLFDDDEARKRVDALRIDHEARIEKLEASARGQIELANQIESLKAEIAKLRGQLEVMTNDLDQAQKRQRDFYVDLDTRLRKIESSAQTADATQAPAAADPANETRDYEAALNLLKVGKTKEAANGFVSFIRAYPKSSFLPSAHFWAASALYQGRNVAEAAKLFSKVAENWPDDARAPDALLGLSNSQLELGDKKGAKASLEKILSRYPSSPAAQSAKQRLGRK
jgi:tol-pal system protein YbgF